MDIKKNFIVPFRLCQSLIDLGYSPSHQMMLADCFKRLTRQSYQHPTSSSRRRNSQYLGFITYQAWNHYQWPNRSLKYKENRSIGIDSLDPSRIHADFSSKQGTKNRILNFSALLKKRFDLDPHGHYTWEITLTMMSLAVNKRSMASPLAESSLTPSSRKSKIVTLTVYVNCF